MTTDELRAKFEATFAKPPYEWSFGRVSENGAWPGHYCAYYKQTAWEGFLKGHASRDAEVEALKRDAERYRWLSRKHANPVEKDWYVYGATGPFLSDSIDAAMREESK